FRIGSAYIDMDSADFERVRAVEREDAPVGALELRVEHAADTGGGSEDHQWEGKAAAQHSRRLLATMAWKSKRLVSTGRANEPEAADLCRCWSVDRHRQCIDRGDRTACAIDRAPRRQCRAWRLRRLLRSEGRGLFRSAAG